MVRDGTGGWRLSPSPTQRMTALTEDPVAVRWRMRALRRNLAPDVRHAAERAIRAHLRRLGIWKRGRRVSTFLSFGGEVDLRGTFSEAWRAGAQLFVPLITQRRTGRMSFVPITPTTAFGINWYGIEEPSSGLEGQKFLREMDVVLVPTVAFDARGHRLGMGAGYYDRALQRRRDRSRAWRRPLLVGIAFGFQEVACDRTRTMGRRARRDRHRARHPALPTTHLEGRFAMKHWLLQVRAGRLRRRPSRARTAAYDGLGGRAQLPGAQHAAR